MSCRFELVIVALVAGVMVAVNFVVAVIAGVFLSMALFIAVMNRSLVRAVLDGAARTSFLAELASRCKELKIFNTICNPTIERQEAARELAREVEVVIVVGGKNSSNTRHLAEVCREEGAVAHHIEDADELDPTWVQGKSNVGVTAGASAPESLVTEVIDALAPRRGVEVVRVTTEDEYFPPPPELRELLRAVAAALVVVNGSGSTGQTEPVAGDREVSAADILELLNTQMALADARQERVRSLADWRSARLRLLATSGILSNDALDP